MAAQVEVTRRRVGVSEGPCPDGADRAVLIAPRPAEPSRPPPIGQKARLCDLEIRIAGRRETAFRNEVTRYSAETGVIDRWRRKASYLEIAAASHAGASMQLGLCHAEEVFEEISSLVPRTGAIDR